MSVGETIGEEYICWVEAEPDCFAPTEYDDL